MSDNMKLFLEKLSKDQELLKNVSAMTEKADIIAAAGELGFELTKADFEASDREMSEAELSAVAGGEVTCFCPIVGGGTSLDGLNTPCACIGGGGGVDYAGITRCACLVTGIGEDIWL